MKKMPCLFVRDFTDKRKPLILPEWMEECLWVRDGEGEASRKWDGTACLVQDGVLFKRYDFKQSVRDKGGSPPEGFIPCQPEPDPITGHHPGWVPVLANDPQSKWHHFALLAAINLGEGLSNGTYELCGPHFQANPEKFMYDVFVPHGVEVVTDAPRTFDGLREFLSTYEGEGLVFKHPDGRMAKIRCGDFT